VARRGKKKEKRKIQKTINKQTNKQNLVGASFITFLKAK
jgi:hypothetical protein